MRVGYAIDCPSKYTISFRFTALADVVSMYFELCITNASTLASTCIEALPYPWRASISINIQHTLIWSANSASLSRCLWYLFEHLVACCQMCRLHKDGMRQVLCAVAITFINLLRHVSIQWKCSRAIVKMPFVSCETPSSATALWHFVPEHRNATHLHTSDNVLKTKYMYVGCF